MFTAKPCLLRHQLLGALLLVCATARAQSPVLVVDDDGGPGVDYTSIAAAVDVASPNSVILVGAGNYGPFEIVSRSLMLVAESGAVVKVQGGEDLELAPAIVVRDLGANDAVVLEGLQAAGTMGFFFSIGTPALRIDGCAGQVWVQDCQLTGGSGTFLAIPALEVVDSDNVLVIGGTMQGQTYFDNGVTPLRGAGVQASGSRIHLWDTQATGGAGAPGADLLNGFLFASRSVLQGGQGVGLLAGFGCQLMLNGGTGLHLGTGSPTAVVFGTQLVAGPADPGGCSFPGIPYSVEGGTLLTLTGTAPGFQATSPGLDGAPLTFSFTDAAPGDSGAVLVATTLGTVPYFAKYTGALAVGSPWFFLIGPVSPAGTLDVTVNLGDALPPGTGATFFAQGALLKAGGGAVLSAPAAITQYDG